MKTFIAILALSLAAFAQSVTMPGPGQPAASGGSGGTVLYYGSGCAGTSTVTCNTAGDNPQSSLVGYPVGTTFTTGANGAGYTATHCAAYFTAKDGTLAHYRCAIYSLPSGTGTLVTNCSQSSDQAIGTAPGWTETAMPASCTLAASTTYIVTVEVDGMATAVGRYMAPVGAGGGRWETMAYGAWSGSLTFNDYGNQYSVYAKVTAN